MTNATLTQYDMRAIIVKLSNLELHNCLADYAVSRDLGTETHEMLVAEAKYRGIL